MCQCFSADTKIQQAPNGGLCGLQDMARVLTKSVMRWWPDEMVPYHRPRSAIEEARSLWEAAQLYEPFDVTGQVGAKYGERR
jgi:hypothetical protein